MVHAETNRQGFYLELRPNRSGTLRGVHIIMGFLLFVFIPTGFVFTLLGAWPVFGFMGAELLLLYGAMRLNQRTTQAVERLSMTQGAFTVERVDPWGQQHLWEFQPQWLRVDLDQPNEFIAHLSLTSRGQRLSLGRFLSPQEKSDAAAHIKGALLPVSMLY